MPDELVSITHSPFKFKENGRKRRKPPVCPICVDKTALLMSDVGGQLEDLFEIIKREQ